MDNEPVEIVLPPRVAAIRGCGFATWAGGGVTEEFKAMFDPVRIPVQGVRNIRVWGLQVDDERELPGHERTMIPDEELWEINLVARDGSYFEVEAGLLVPAPA